MIMGRWLATAALASCQMESARRVDITDIRAYADLINACPSNEAVALGRLKVGVQTPVRVTAAHELNGHDQTTIARTKDFLIFEPGKGGLVLIDFDPKGMSEAARQQFNEYGGLIGALCEVVPVLETTALVKRSSTSSALRNAETGESYLHSGGEHIVIPVIDAADIPRFLSDLHARSWLAGLGWGIVSGCGSFLERSIVDKSCGSPERLIFEGAPIIKPPLVQAARQAITHDGTVLDTGQCAPLTDDELAKLQKLIAAERRRLLPQCQAVRAEWSLKHIEHLIDRGVSETEARAQVDRWIDHHELTGAFELPFDKSKFSGATVDDIFVNPDRFVNQTMADPLKDHPMDAAKQSCSSARMDRCLLIRSPTAE